MKGMKIWLVAYFMVIGLSTWAQGYHLVHNVGHSGKDVHHFYKRADSPGPRIDARSCAPRKKGIKRFVPFSILAMVDGSVKRAVKAARWITIDGNLELVEEHINNATSVLTCGIETTAKELINVLRKAKEALKGIQSDRDLYFALWGSLEWTLVHVYRVFRQTRNPSGLGFWKNKVKPFFRSMSCYECMCMPVVDNSTAADNST